MEPSLVNLLRRAIPGIVETVGPQEHEQVGSAERSVRLLKERLSCLRADSQGAGFDIVLKEETLPRIVRYIATTHNYHRSVRGSDRTPMEWIVGQKRAPFASALFGTVVFAEVALSVVSPPGRRWIQPCI